MKERPSKQSPARLETAEFEPGLLDNLGPEDIARLERGEALPPAAAAPPVPAAGGAGTPAADVESIDLPVHAVAYEAPREPPGRTNHDTFEMQTVTVESAEDPRKAPTQRKLQGPVERHTIPVGSRREPTLRGRTPVRLGRTTPRRAPGRRRWSYRARRVPRQSSRGSRTRNDRLSNPPRPEPAGAGW